ncbi:hypothetical protein K2P97_06650 [bacterium]|nr:hypothetical protein [bacterium]
MLKNLLIALVIATPFAWAEEVNVNVDKIKTEDNQQTTITVKKGTGNQNQNTKKYEITEGTDDVTGDKAPLRKTAEINWKKACKEWSTEFKEANKENKIISHSCGKMECSKEGVESTCVSKAKYKVKTLIEE